MKTKIIPILIFIPLMSFGCFHGESTRMMETLNKEKNEIIVMRNAYEEFSSAIQYFYEVKQSGSSLLARETDCLYYVGNAKNNFVRLTNEIDSIQFPILLYLEKASDTSISMIDIYSLACSGKITKDNINLAEALWAELGKKLVESHDTFLGLYNDLVNKYDYDLYVYSNQVTGEINRKYEFWSQFANALATGLASGLSNRSSSGPSTYSLMDLGGGYYSVMDMNTGQLKTCNAMGNIVNCF